MSYFSDIRKSSTTRKRKTREKINNTRGQCYFSYLFIVQNIKNEINKDKKKKIQKKIGSMRSRTINGQLKNRLQNIFPNLSIFHSSDEINVYTAPVCISHILCLS